MLAEASAAAIVGAALLWIVLQPMLLPSMAPAVPDDPPDIDETPRGRALLALKEIEFDRATGKLSDDDFGMLHRKYSAIAVAALEADAAQTKVPSTRSDQIEAMVAARAATLADGGARFCTQCGSRMVGGAAFCSRCGAAST